MTSLSSLPIGLFDSGVGGLTVLQAMRQALPSESFLYLGDTARVPYGNKSKDTIVAYSRQNSDFLLEKKIKLLVIACNTASSYALDHLQKELSIPVIGVVHPGAKKAIITTKNNHIGVIATKGTIRTGAYQNRIQSLLPTSTVIAKACPIFVPLIEENLHLHPASKLLIEDSLSSFKENKIDTLVLGCTHYPLLKEIIQTIVGNAITLVDSASSCAEEVQRTLKEKQLLNCSYIPGNTHYYVSDDPTWFQEQAKTFLDLPIPSSSISLFQGTISADSKK